MIMDDFEQSRFFDRWQQRHSGLLFKVVRAYAFNSLKHRATMQSIDSPTETLGINVLPMLQRSFAMRSVCILAALLVCGCTHVNYVGDEYDPTTIVDIYFSEDAIDKEYDLIGHGLGSGFWVRNRKIRNKLIDEAKSKGADAMLITGLGRSHALISNGVSAGERQINVTFLRYK